MHKTYFLTRVTVSHETRPPLARAGKRVKNNRLRFCVVPRQLCIIPTKPPRTEISVSGGKSSASVANCSYPAQACASHSAAGSVLLLILLLLLLLLFRFHTNKKMLEEAVRECCLLIIVDMLS
jgi:hypothetical protein